MRLVDDPDAVAVSVSPVRRRLLSLLDRPASATQLADRMGTTRQRVNYHLRELERVGLVRLVEERRRRGVTERVLARVDDLPVVDPFILVPAGLADRDRAGVAGVMAAARDAIREVAAVTTAAVRSRRRVAASALQAAVRLTAPSELHDLTADLGNLLARYDAGEAAAAVPYRVTVLVHPALPPAPGRDAA